MVTWSEVPDHDKLTGTDHQIKRDAEQVNETWSGTSSYCYNDKFIIYLSHIIEKL